MKRTAFVAMAKNRGMGKRDAKGKPVKGPAGGKADLRSDLIHYFTNTPEGQDAWARRPQITGEGVADYLTIEEMVEALLLEVDEL